MKQSKKAYFGLAAITILWGISFPVMDVCLRSMGPFTFVGIRYLLAAVVMSLIRKKGGQRAARKEIIKAIYIGVPFAFAAVLQMIGLKSTSVTNAAFITSLTVVFVPLIVFLFERVVPGKSTCIGIGLSFFGVALMANLQSLSINPGDLWVLLAAVAFSLQIYHLEKYGKGIDAAMITEMMLWMVGLGTLPVSLLMEKGAVQFVWQLIPAFIFVSVICTVVAIQLQNRLQPLIPAAHAAVLYLLEPVAATLVSLLIGVSVGGHQLAGALLILGGTFCIIAFQKEKNIIRT